ncbi:hypothetical protein E1H18_1303 [Caulobacter sp. RHG1]|nr:hypothetical protein [Caulobacter sp. RHG1]
MRAWPRLVASARTAVRTVRGSSCTRPVVRWVKHFEKPVQRSTSASRSVMRMAGKWPYKGESALSASSGVMARSGDIRSLPPEKCTSSSASASTFASTSASLRERSALRSSSQTAAVSATGTGNGPAALIAVNTGVEISCCSTALYRRLPSTHTSPARKRSRNSARTQNSKIRRSRPARPIRRRHAGRTKPSAASAGSLRRRPLPRSRIVAMARARPTQAGTAPKVKLATKAGPICRRIGRFDRASSTGSSGSGRTSRLASSISEPRSSHPITSSMALRGSAPLSLASMIAVPRRASRRILPLMVRLSRFSAASSRRSARRNICPIKRSNIITASSVRAICISATVAARMARRRIAFRTDRCCAVSRTPS